jgi:hypothetical protein
MWANIRTVFSPTSALRVIAMSISWLLVRRQEKGGLHRP